MIALGLAPAWRDGRPVVRAGVRVSVERFEPVRRGSARPLDRGRLAGPRELGAVGPLTASRPGGSPAGPFDVRRAGA
ncbi:hypothetical protein LZG04_02790 [Saccharothrix sp. S26]|uniref:hypothetical protein n=1 Tax=Saccharothrix sp. S26 TaxID=2907215 RepID=UPI001F1E35CE|nr:hypothetical protein [Saccharothrix sp. S26]MCE6993739.1 hypothetical protein [Saccharothrix sp. S26]